MEKSQIADYAWKGFTIMLSMIVIPSFIWIWDSEMRLGALEYKMDDANKSLDKIVQHIESETGDNAVNRETHGTKSYRIRKKTSNSQKRRH